VCYVRELRHFKSRATCHCKLSRDVRYRVMPATNMVPIEAALAGLDSLSPNDDYVYSDIAVRHGVDRRTLARRHQGITTSQDDKTPRQQKPTPWQGKELLSWIDNEHKSCIPPT
jgi:hypothetical protein